MRALLLGIAMLVCLSSAAIGAKIRCAHGTVAVDDPFELFHDFGDRVFTDGHVLVLHNPARRFCFVVRDAEHVQLLDPNSGQVQDLDKTALSTSLVLPMNTREKRQISTMLETIDNFQRVKMGLEASLRNTIPFHDELTARVFDSEYSQLKNMQRSFKALFGAVTKSFDKKIA
jgi:hypothetical protein